MHWLPLPNAAPAPCAGLRTALRAIALCCGLGFMAIPAQGQVVEDSFAMDPGPLNFISGEGPDQRMLQFLCGDALVGTDAHGNLVARLAKSWEVRPGEVRFNLRKDATFVGGHRVFPEDVRWTLEALLSDPKASPVKRQLLQGCTVSIQAGQVVVRHRKPAERLLRELATVPITRSGHPTEGSGPFQLDRSGGGEWHLKRRAHFLGPKVDGFHFRILGDAQAILQALQKGWLHLGVPPLRVQGAPPSGYRQITQPLPGQLIIWSHTGSEPLRWIGRWRKEAFPPHLLGSAASVSQGLWPTALGFKPRAIDAPKSAFGDHELIYPGGDGAMEAQLQALAARAAKDGVTLKLQPLAAEILEKRLMEGQFDLACAVATFDPHPWSILDLVDPAGPYNFGGFKDPSVAPLLKSLDTPQAPAWALLEARWAAGLTSLPILDYHSVVWVHQRLEVIPSPVGFYFSTPGPAGWRWH
jgi:ABC-type transport system substrate-binding protein